MRSMLCKAALIVAAGLATVTAIPDIVVKGSKFFAGDEQFYIKGFAFQGTGNDPLVNITQCTFDMGLMKLFGTNSVRVYHVDPTKDHTACMTILANAGIYLWVDLDTFDTALHSIDPAWTLDQFQKYAKVMDAFQTFPNTAGFFVGNEVINSNNNSNAAPYIKAASADMRAYRDKMGYRKIPIGYSAADIAELRPQLQNYLACGDTKTTIEFFGLNSYEWCGNSTYDSSGYHNLQNLAENYTIPIFFSETGCIVPRPRTFGDQLVIFGPEMSGTWSGAIIYEWVNEGNDYGVVDYKNTEYGGPPIPMDPEFTTLRNIWKSATPNEVKKSDYNPNKPTLACPPSVEGAWKVNGDEPLPTLGAATLNSIVRMKKRQASMHAVPPSHVYWSGKNGPKKPNSGSSRIEVGVQSVVLGLFMMAVVTFFSM
ncbi:902370c0-4472-425c-b9a0-dc13c71d614c [Sclerotinia trifoliorum]|uniref:1,3-beta-glucanosyltransferase n=1 Tax=Sclerotinia trifoliorum TaxID=28548 RepID=A0A8H2VYI0_9HELO|nr:902370c0-4472-425c-b9a0-dc13c71d614c [Sclerotinia trifoliorum]